MQRVNRACVTYSDAPLSSPPQLAIARGLLLYVGLEKQDELAACLKLAQKALEYRIFPDQNGRMAQGLLHEGALQGELLAISQFTLPAATKKGLSPSFSPALEPDAAREMYAQLSSFWTEKLGESAKISEFGSDIQVESINDGPINFLLRTSGKI